MRRWLAFLALALSGFFATGLTFGMNSPELQGLTSNDALNRATEAATMGSESWIHDQQTAFDQAGNVTKLKEDFFTAAIAPRTTVNTYDGAGRLLSESAMEPPPPMINPPM